MSGGHLPFLRGGVPPMAYMEGFLCRRWPSVVCERWVKRFPTFSGVSDPKTFARGWERDRAVL